MILSLGLLPHAPFPTDSSSIIDSVERSLKELSVKATALPAPGVPVLH